MMAQQVPALFDAQDALKGHTRLVSRPFQRQANRRGSRQDENDSEKIAVILVDYQHDFVDPTGTLYVPGSQQDVARFLTWFYANAHRITSIYASLDTHLPFQIFYSSWWENPQTGEHPPAITPITLHDATNKRWAPLFQPDWSVRYVHQLQEQARKDLMIWPYHTMEGTLGLYAGGAIVRQ